MQRYIEKIPAEPFANLVRHLQGMIRGRLWLKILIALFSGIAAGVLLSPETGLIGEKTANVIGSWLALPGNIFLSLLQMVVVPLIFASVIRGLAAGKNMDYLQRIGIRVVIYFLITTIVAITIGITATSIIQPGKLISEETAAVAPPAEAAPGVDSSEELALENIPEIITGLIPENPLGSMVEREMLQVVLFAVIIGLALVVMDPRQSQPLLSLLGSLQEVCMAVVRWAMLLAPLAVFGLLAQVTIKTGLSALLGMAVYVVTALLGPALMLCIYLIPPPAR